MPKPDYPAVFTGLLSPFLTNGSSISQNDLFQTPALGSTSDKTKLSHLKKFIGQNPQYLGSVHGVLPPAEVIIDLAQEQLGQPISEANVLQANRTCAAIVKRVAGPAMEEFVRSGLAQAISDGTVSIPLQDLIEFLMEEFASFARGAGNGLVSVAGSLNEKLLARCLRAGGLTSEEFSVTGTDSEGDIIVHSKSGAKANLNVEIKSYHARERLLRGLRDIQSPKVGAGYFKDPGEFNRSRTITLQDTQAAAIYMPTETLEKLASEVRNMKTTQAIAYGSCFYRPLERFASDMKRFADSGTLPSAQ